jgi:hypothetical protein
MSSSRKFVPLCNQVRGLGENLVKSAPCYNTGWLDFDNHGQPGVYGGITVTAGDGSSTGDGGGGH